jgi:hypothetical protein
MNNQGIADNEGLEGVILLRECGYESRKGMTRCSRGWSQRGRDLGGCCSERGVLKRKKKEGHKGACRTRTRRVWRGKRERVC